MAVAVVAAREPARGMHGGEARASSKGTYICVTAVVWVSTADEVHRLYEAVQQVPGLKRVL